MSDTLDRADGRRSGGGPPGGIGGGGQGGRGGGMPGGGGRGGRGGGMPGGRDREEMPRARGLAQGLTKAADRLTIVLDGTRVIITTDDGRSVKLQTDGKEEERLTGDGVIKSKTRWNGEQLVSEDKIQDGPKVTRTYTVSSDLRQLIVTLKIDGGGMSGQALAHHVFDRREGPPGGP